MSDEHGHDQAHSPGLLRSVFERLFDTTIEKERVHAIRDYLDIHPEIEEGLRISEAELAAHRFLGMSDFVLLKTKVRFSKTIRLLRDWTEGEIYSSKVLDIGASDGLMLKLFDLSGVALDINDYWPSRMKAKQILGVQALAEALPFKDKVFDYVMCYECLEHVENPIALISGIERVCRKGLFVSVPWVSKTKIRANDYNAERNAAADHHVFEFNDADFRKIISHTPFRVAHHHPVRIYNVPSFGISRLVRERLQLHVPSWSLYMLELKP